MTMKKPSMDNLESTIAISRCTIKQIKILHILLTKPTVNFLSIVTGQRFRDQAGRTYFKY